MLWAFLLVEFIGTGISEFASYLSVLLLGIAFVGLVPEVASADAGVAERVSPEPATL